jgi:hypothetical protein
MNRATISRRCWCVIVALVPISLSGALCRSGEPNAPAAPEWDARCVKTEVPAKLLTDQVFQAKIAIQNAGTRPWSDGLKLRSQGPLDNAVWGTTYIIMGQGRSCKPGAEIAFTSYLKAPHAPGKYTFQWRVARNGDGAMFGQSTPAETIVVEARPAEPPPEKPAADPSRKPVLSAADFEYAGSFKLPEAVEGCGSAFTESGLALRKAADGKTLFVATGLQKKIVYEATIPELVKLEGADHKPLKTAKVKRTWGELKLPKQVEGETIHANAGFWWDEDHKTLYWSYYHGYMTGRVPVLAASRLEEGKPPAHGGPWYIPETSPWYKAYWGGVTQLPKEFADRYTGGRRLALGFGGYYSICAAASRGPALCAIAEPDPAKSTVDLLDLLVYPWPKEIAAPRDGGYFVANCEWGGAQPRDPDRGWWTMDDWSRAGVFIDLPEKHGLLMLAYLGTGRMGYDYGTITSAGHASWWYFYDPQDLAAAAQGKRKPWEIEPHSRARIRYPRGVREGTEWGPGPGNVTGCCFDQETRLLYVYQQFCIDNGSRELFPCVHVYRVK